MEHMVQVSPLLQGYAMSSGTAHINAIGACL